jgi:prepilin-type N-terminal cleavage/methylation domain-containing protein
VGAEPRQSRFFLQHRQGFTLLELLAVLGILVALIALSVPMFETIRPRVERVVCINNLKNLRVAFGDYAITGWPQIPEGVALGSMDEQRWWLEKTQKELGLSERSWQCPTIRRMFAKEPERERPLIHYLPTPFSAEPGKANQAPMMPWFIEIGDAHGEGNLLVRQNGTVEPSPK